MPSSDMDTERPKSREDVVLTENTDDFIIGDRVWVNGTKPGYIQYLGETRFSPGDWAGVVLDDHSGKNDGTVAGVHYFQCEPKRGVFARLHKLTRYPLLHATPPPTKLGDSLSPTPPPSLQRCLTPTRTPSPGARNVREGDRVTVPSATGPPKTGVLRYLGHTDFAAGEWAGIELDDPLGKNDGTVAGKRYFRCPSNYGLFSPAHKVSRITGSLDRHRRTHMDTEKENSSQQGSTHSLQDDNKKYPEESEKRAQRLRQLLETAEAERRSLAAKLEEERRKVEELEFRIEEECIGKDDLEADREKERRKIEELQRRLEQELRKSELVARGATPDSILKDETKRLNEETKSLREKLRQAEVKIHELHTMKQPQPTGPLLKVDELMKKEEALLQAQLSLDNKKREVQNLLDRMAELEKDLEKSKARQTRQLDAIDDLNVKLQKFETKCANLGEELHASKEKTLETERRLDTSAEQVSLLEKGKRRLEKQLLSPESTSKEQELLARLQDREKEVSKWKSEAEGARVESDRVREDREKVRKDAEEKLRSMSEQHREESRKEKKWTAEAEESNSKKIRDLEHQLSHIQGELESARMEAEARLSRQEARLQEAELKTESADRLREQISRLQAEKDLLRVEKEETYKRLQISEQSRARWESEAGRASEEVSLLKSQVQHLRTEFFTHREDLVKKLAETKFDAEVVQDLHLQIEEQRHIVEAMQLRLKYTEGERDQLQTKLTTRRQDQIQVENSLKQEMETLKRRLTEAEQEKQSFKRSLEATQLLIEERTTAQKQQQIQDRERLEKEKSTLDNKIADLQVELFALKNGKHEPDLSYEDLRNEKDALEQQVNFMNSVIVDMQHKNDDLRSRLDILETEVIFDGHLQLGLPHNRSTSRLFCDICDIFDVHDTEDCPKQKNHSVRRNLSYSSQESEF